jgi:DNA-dependent RNA polymerase auxiliary subunit epsilon
MSSLSAGLNKLNEAIARVRKLIHDNRTLVENMKKLLDKTKQDYEKAAATEAQARRETSKWRDVTTSNYLIADSNKNKLIDCYLSNRISHSVPPVVNPFEGSA